LYDARSIRASVIIERAVMRCTIKLAATVLALLISRAALADTFAKVDADLTKYDAAIQNMKDEFGKVAGDTSDKDWVKKKLQHMVDIDQHMRNFSMSVPHDHQYTKAEQDYFFKQFLPRWKQLDGNNTANLKSLLETYSWFTISAWGKAADSNAWLLVQHADEDPDFQKEILAKLETLYPSRETRPDHYAYLYDRVAISSKDATKRTLQRYGTQGRCTAPGQWEPFPIEDEANVDLRRAEVGLPPLADYIAGFKDICR
jgi:hypothetical protein